MSKPKPSKQNFVKSEVNTCISASIVLNKGDKYRNKVVWVAKTVRNILSRSLKFDCTGVQNENGLKFPCSSYYRIWHLRDKAADEFIFPPEVKILDRQEYISELLIDVLHVTKPEKPLVEFTVEVKCEDKLTVTFTSQKDDKNSQDALKFLSNYLPLFRLASSLSLNF